MSLKRILFIGFSVCCNVLMLVGQMEDNLRPPAGTRFNNGLNPFLAPVDTTDYRGSGDVNLDGIVNSGDITAISEILAGLKPQNPQADTDGNGTVGDYDRYLIGYYITYGTPLPGVWNGLTTREARIDWVNKMLAIDDTNTLSYVSPWWICGQFAEQLASSFRGYRVDDLDSVNLKYNRNQTIFNIPMYRVFVGGTGHGIAAVLVGDDPEVFTDWYFIEPQDDSALDPGEGLLQPGIVKIEVFEYRSTYNLVQFVINADLTTGHVASDRDLVTERPLTLPTPDPDNGRDYWDPKILDSGTAKVVFTAARKDLDRYGDMDIHETELPFSENAAKSVIAQSSVMSRLLDVYKDSAGVNHILYTDKPKFQVENNQVNILGLYHGIYDENQHKIVNSEQVVQNEIVFTANAKMCAEPNGMLHVFWYQTLNIGRAEGLWWTSKSGSTWQTPILLVDSNTMLNSDEGNWKVRNLKRGLFSVEYSGGKVHLAWIDKEHVPVWEDSTFVWYDYFDVKYMAYANGSWSAPAYVTDYNNVTGLDIEADKQGNIHLVYQRGANTVINPALSSFVEGRGSLSHKVYNGTSWSTASFVDGTNTNLMPNLDLEPITGDLYLAWEKQLNGRVYAAWSKYTGSQWSTAQTLPIRDNADAWYPTVKALDEGNVIVAFNSECPDRVTIETYEIYAAPQPTAAVTVLYENHETASATNTIRSWFKVKNEGTSGLDLSEVTIRYWYTREGTADQNGFCDYAGIAGTNITSYVNTGFTQVNPVLSGANYYMEISFDSGVGTLAPGQSTEAIQIRFSKSDWTNYTQTLDYSWNSSMTSFGENQKITGYVGSVLAFGDMPE